MTTNYISEDYCSEEIRSLLEEKGYIGATNTYLDKDGYRVKEITLQSAMKWLREVHNLLIAVIVAYHHIPRRYEVHIMKIENIDDFILHRQIDFASYEEACEAGIKYCLENLI